MNSRVQAATERPSFALGPWLWGPRRDLAVFGGSAGGALLLVAAGRAFGFGGGELPEWGWLLFVLGIDVAHVYSTLFRTYLDRAELAAHRVRYFLMPVLVYAAGVLLYRHGTLTFWRVLAYLAVFHFVRQQVGWVAVYRARAGTATRLDALLDSATTYAAMLYPLVAWHAQLEHSHFSWFVRGDFLNVAAWAGAILPYARAIWGFLLFVFFARQAQLALTARTLALGKCVVVASTAAIWYVGIVVTNSDFDFTVTNVVAHGVPYVALLWFYARERKKDEPNTLGAAVLAGGPLGFVGSLVLLAFIEELCWDRWVWADQSWLFGGDGHPLSQAVLSLLVPLLALPQTVHYVLDGFLWRRGDTRRIAAQRRALGFAAPARLRSSAAATRVTD